MKKLALWLLLTLPTAGWAAQTELKPRLVVCTDIAPADVEPDDMESMVRLMAYADLFEIEALITSVGWNCDPYPKEWAQYLFRVIEAYRKDVPQLMKEAVSRIAAPAIRNAGTFGGNLGNGSAKADSVLIEFVSDAKLRLVSAKGERIVAVEDFYLGRKKLDLRDDELIAEVLLPKTGLEQYSYEKVGGRNALAISRVSFAGVFAVRDGRIANVAAAFGAVADTVLRYKDIEAMLIGRTVDEAKALKADYLKAYAQRMVLTRGRVSAEYRKNVCLNLLGDFLTKFGI